jgi:hypothetical protein
MARHTLLQRSITVECRMVKRRIAPVNTSFDVFVRRIIPSNLP